jgi:PAS domain S-box-containing protein
VLVSYIDAERRYRFCNVAYERWFGCKKHEIAGKHMTAVLGTEAFEHIRHHVDTALAGNTVTFEAHVPYRHGGERFIEATYIPDRDAQGLIRGFVALVSDISGRKRLETAREATAKQTERLMKITAAIAEAVTPEEVFQAVVDEVRAVLGASSAALWLVDRERRSARLLHGSGRLAPDGSSAELMLDGPVRFPATEAIETGQPVFVGSKRELVERYPHLASLATPGAGHASAFLPLVVQGRTPAALGITFDTEASLGDEQQSFLMLVARYGGQALERLRLLGSERQSRSEAEAFAARMALLSRASRPFSEDPSNLSALFDRVMAELTASFADGATIGLVSETGERLEFAAFQHRNAEAAAAMQALPERSLALGEGISGRVAKSGQTAFFPSVDAAALELLHPSHRAALDAHLPRSLIVAPLRARGRIAGTLCVMRSQGSPAFTDDDKTLLEELAERAATAIESARLYRDNQQARQRAEILYRLVGSVIGASRVDEVFSAALDAIEGALGARRASILLFDPDGVMRFKAWRNLSDGYRQAVEGHSPWTRDTQDPEPLLVPNVEEDPGLSPYLPVFRRESIAALGFIPLVAGGRLVGKFMVYYREPRVLSAHEIELARAIANHVAVATERFAAIAKLEQTVRFNELFTAVLGHDLRNPLNAIMTAAQLASKRDDNEKLSKPLGRILTSGNRMARMIDQLLDFTRVRVGAGIPLQPKSMDVVALVRQVLDELDDANPGCKLELDHQGETTGAWDHDRLAQVFSNLVGNAVQHGVADHGVHVHVDGTRPDAVRVEIHNHGAIPAEELPTLFEPMTSSESRRHRAQGLGLGLFITQQIARAHRGSVSVSSSAEQGTTFQVWLPRSIAEKPARNEDPDRR